LWESEIVNQVVWKLLRTLAKRPATVVPLSNHQGVKSLPRKCTGWYPLSRNVSPVGSLSGKMTLQSLGASASITVIMSFHLNRDKDGNGNLFEQSF